jgi:hypothetical protein
MGRPDARASMLGLAVLHLDAHSDTPRFATLGEDVLAVCINAETVRSGLEARVASAWLQMLECWPAGLVATLVHRYPQEQGGPHG